MMSNIIIKIMKTINKSENHSEKKQHKTWQDFKNTSLVKKNSHSEDAILKCAL